MEQLPRFGGELLNAEEVARYLEMQPVTIYRWCREGRLPCMKLGKVWRIRRTVLENFLRPPSSGVSTSMPWLLG